MKKQQDPVDEILRAQGQAGEKVTLANLKNKNRHSEPDEEVYSRLQKLKKTAQNENSMPSDKLNSYFCSLCGRIVFVTNVYMESLEKRRTDSSIAISLLECFLKLSLDREKVKYIKRESGVETQYRWKCECGITIGYTGISYDQFEQLRQDDKIKPTNRPYFYVYDGAVTERMKESKLVSEVITYKETILLHLKRKNKK